VLVDGAHPDEESELSARDSPLASLLF